MSGLYLQRKRSIGVLQRETTMAIMKTLSVIAILSAAIAAPAFARDAGPERRIHHGQTHHHHVWDHKRRHLGGGYDPNPQFQRNTENFGFRGRDPSRIGGEDPNLHPSAY
jgi:hypothetical protein